MSARPWFDGPYPGSIDELLALGDSYRIDSLLTALEDELMRKEWVSGESALTDEERIVLAVEMFEREVNNGGYRLFFTNLSRKYTPTIVAAFRRIGCAQVADITRSAIDALGVRELTGASVGNSMATRNAERDAILDRCDRQFFARSENIEVRLFEFVAQSRERICRRAR